MIKLLNKAAAKFEIKLVSSVVELSPDLKSDILFMNFYEFCRPYTMTSPERLFALYQAVKNVVANNIPGSFVECGVWKGGSSMMTAKVLQHLGVTDRLIYMYDTYEGMTEPTIEDRDYTGENAAKLLSQEDKADSNSIWCYSSIDEVRSNFKKTGYPEEQVQFIKGKVEDTIPGVIPEKIALLRLDTDWYASTYHEMIHLYPLLQQKGILIIDDFGHWEGAKKAILQYFSEQQLSPLINRIDETGRIVIKY